METVDVIIPAYRPGEKFHRLLKMLSTQEYPVGKIIIVNTEKKYLDESSIQVPNVEVHHIRKEEFDHGATRRLGISFSQADFFLLMTDDAVPADAFLVSRLAAVLRGDPEAASVYARQLPTEESSEDERLAREFNYPGVSRRKTRADLPVLGIKTYFGSNVCCMYRRSIYDSLGGFVSRTIFNEDMLYQAAAIQAGYAVHYCAEAEVFHAHHYSGLAQLKRNFDLGVSQAEHPEVFRGISSEGEGLRMLGQNIRSLLRRKKILYIPYLFYITGCKLTGFRLGRSFRHLPRWLIKRLSMNPEYWRKNT